LNNSNKVTITIRIKITIIITAEITITIRKTIEIRIRITITETRTTKVVRIKIVIITGIIKMKRTLTSGPIVVEKPNRETDCATMIRWYLITSPQRVTAQTTNNDIFTVRTSNLRELCFQTHVVYTSKITKPKFTSM
jgi:hypothetical protein